MDLLATPLPRLVGAATSRSLATLDLHTGEDLLRHYPRRYAERGQLTDLSALTPGDSVTISARVRSVTTRPLPRQLGQRKERSIQKVVVTDGDDELEITFFNQHWLARTLRPGVEALFAGKVDSFRGVPRLTSPEVEVSDDADAFAGAPVPIYGANATMSSLKIRKTLRIVLDQLPDVLPDPLPADVRRAERLPTLAEAFRLVHRPRSRADVERGRRRFRYEEAFVLQTVLAQRRRAARSVPAVPRRRRPGGLLDAFDARLPFTLTTGQCRVGSEIAADLGREHPMHRLLQGEVGSGKTVVAVRAMLTVVDGGGQCALLAPTEVLAQQHHRSITTMLGPLAEGGLLGGDERGTQVALLTGSQPGSARRQALLATASGSAGIVVGTHALLEERVDFADLGLVVVDEQHRFGVEQRDALRAKSGTPPHVLVMTATPIPRTVAITVFGDLDVSTLEELPGGRAPISTHVVPSDRPGWVDRTWVRVREEVAAGHRAYVVCPRIGGDDGPLPDDEDDGSGSAATVLTVLEELRGRAELAGLAIDALHGRLPPDAKDDVMRRFTAGEVQVLVATTVVEVGVDVPEATVMVVLGADRFGISQLHQLRGRVGRGAAPGLCLLFTDAPEGSLARARVEAVARTTDGFALSRLDLEQRREGDVLGAAQAGRRSSLRALAVVRDEALIVTARETATALVETDPDLARQPALAAAVDDLLDADRAAYLAKA